MCSSSQVGSGKAETRVEQNDAKETAPHELDDDREEENDIFYIYIYIILGRQSPCEYHTNISNITTVTKYKKNTIYTYKL